MVWNSWRYSITGKLNLVVNFRFLDFGRDIKKESVLTRSLVIEYDVMSDFTSEQISCQSIGYSRVSLFCFIEIDLVHSYLFEIFLLPNFGVEIVGRYTYCFE